MFVDEFKNKVVIITGGASGIGKSIAEEFCKLKAKTVIIDKNTPDVNCDYFYKGDITKKEVLINFSDDVIKKYKKIDFLINNAGLSKGGLLSCDLDDFLYVQRLSLFAPFALVKLFLNNFNKGAAIINIASTRAFQSQKDWESYAAAKGGMISLTHSMAITLKNIARVNSISPGWINTNNCDLTEEDVVQHPANCIGEAVDISNMVLFLCSTKAKFITGENIIIDGGMSKLMVYHNDCGWMYKKEP